MENDFHRACHMLQFARQRSAQSPYEAIEILHQCVGVFNRLAAFVPQARRMQLETYAELAANHFFLANWTQVVDVTTAALIGPLHFISDVQYFCLCYRCEAFERLRRHKEALNDCSLLLHCCPSDARRKYEMKMDELWLNIEMEDRSYGRMTEVVREQSHKKEKVVEFPQVVPKKKSAKELKKDEFRRKQEMEEIGRQLQQRNVAKEASPPESATATSKTNEVDSPPRNEAKDEERSDVRSLPSRAATISPIESGQNEPKSTLSEKERKERKKSRKRRTLESVRKREERSASPPEKQSTPVEAKARSPPQVQPTTSQKSSRASVEKTETAAVRSVGPPAVAERKAVSSRPWSGPRSSPPRSEDVRKAAERLLKAVVSRLPEGEEEEISLPGFSNPEVIRRGAVVCRLCFRKSRFYRTRDTCPRHQVCVLALVWPKAGETTTNDTSAWVEIRPRPLDVKGHFSICKPERCVYRSGKVCTFPHSEQELEAWNLDRYPDRGGIRRIPPRGYRLKLCKTFERFQSCAYGRRCVYAHGDDELERWSAIEERRQKAHLVPELLSQTLRESFLRENYFVLSSTQGRDTLDVVWDPCERWTFIDASKDPPFSFLFNCEITCKKEKKHLVRRIVLLPSSTQSHFTLLYRGRTMKQNYVDCNANSIRFTLQFASDSSLTRSYVQDVVVECDGQPYVLQSLYVDVADGKNLKAIKQLRSTLQLPDQHWTIDPDYAPALSRRSEEAERRYPIPVDAELSNTLSRLRILEKDAPVPRDDRYFERFHALIYLEEIEIKRQLEEFSRRSIDLLDDDENPFSGIKSIDLGCLVPSRLATSAYVRKTDSTRIFLVSVTEIKETVVRLNVTENVDVKRELNDSRDVKIDFQFAFDRAHWLNLHASLDRLPVSTLRSHVQPDFHGAIASRDLSSIDRVLNQVKRYINPDVQFDPKQREAVGRILAAGNGKCPHLIINGPFGTGKTFLLAEAVRLLTEFNRQARILICTQSNFAADLYVKLFHKRAEKRLFNAKLLRVSFAPRKGSLANYLLDRYFYFLDDAESVFRAPPNSRLGKQPLVVVTTLMTSARLREGQFSHIVIDEAAQATEPESIAPLALADSRTALVLAGDTVQSAPPVSSSLARGGKLQRSLFRRLYKAAPDSLKINLVTNYRSQHDLFALIARIFYGAETFSPDQARARIQAVHRTFHPFSFYICGGLAQQGGTDGSYYNQSEAALIADKIGDVFYGWPHEWGKRSPWEVCVVSSEFTQVQYIRQLLRQRGDYYRKVNVATYGGIQGQEFRVVLVSTVMTSTGYRQDYERKPNFLSDAKVLNTVLTRAKSLVIVFGDPDCLTRCKIGRKWQQYIEACNAVGESSLRGDKLSSKFVCKLVMERTALNVAAPSFVPRWGRKEVKVDDSDDDEHPALESNDVATAADDDVTSESSVYEDSPDDGTDEEMERIYREEVVKSFRPKPTATATGKRVIKQVVRGSTVRWTVAKVKRRPPRKIYESRSQEDVGERLRHESRPAYPPHLHLDDMKSLVEEKPESYLKCVLRVSGSNAYGYGVDSEEVFIEGRHRRNRAFDGEEVLVKIDADDEDDDPDDDVKTKRGSVVGIFQKRRPKRFVCQLSKEDKDLMVPIDGSHPIFANGPSTMTRRDDGVRMFSIRRRRIVDEKSVPLWDVEGKLFVVQYLSWRPEFPYPLGIAVECVEAATSLATGRRLLEIQYEVDGDSDDSEAPFVATYEQDDDDDVITNAFTIDPEHSRDLDDALSVERDCDDCAFKVGVYIADVAHHVAFRSDENRQAEERGTSVYDSQGSVQQSMLPRELSSDRCSLLPFRRRRVIAGYFGFDESLKPIENFETTFEEVEIQSCCKLSYSQAQAIICEENPRIDCRPESKQRIFEDVRLLNKIAGLLRERRLASRRFFRESDRCFEAEAHELVEEFMILMNSEVARRLLEERRRLTILYSQRSPRPEKVGSWLSTCGPLVNASQRLVAYGEEAESQGVSLETALERQATLRISKGLWYRIRSAKSLGDRLRLACCNDFVPQLAVCQSHYFRSRQRSVYTCDETDEDFPTNHHDFRRPYTHFTSPIRRYVDLVMQRLLKKYVIESSVDEDELQLVDYEPHDIAKICIDSNFSRREAKLFQRELSLLEFADEVQTYPVATIAVVEEITGHSIGLFVPDCPTMPAQNCSVKLMSLTASSATPADDLRSVSIKWNVDLLTLPTRERRPVRVNPPVPECEFGVIETRLWRDFTDSCIRGDPNRINRLIARIEADPRTGLRATAPRQQHSDFVVSKQKQASSITKTIAVFDLLSVQISSRVQRGVIRPYIQLVNFSDGLSICLDHNERPGRCFGPPLARSSLVRRQKFSDLRRYYEYWSPLVDIEGATASVKSSPIASPTLIREMVVLWRETGEDLPMGETTMNLKFVQENKIAVYRGDYMCLRYFNLPMGEERPPKQDSLSDVWKLESNRKKYHFVLHCTVVDSKERYSRELKEREEVEGSDFQADKDLVKIKFCPCFGSTVTDVQKRQLKQLLLEERTLCMAQTIHCSLPFRRQRRNLERLMEDNDVVDNFLAREMAFGDLNKLKKDAAIRRSDEVGNRRDMSLGDVFGKEAVLNESQYNAVQLALKQKVTLIQGPPGTGKTVTGVHIAWRYANEIREQRDDADNQKKKQKLFICAPSNEAVDLIARKLKRLVANQSCDDDRVTVLRVYSESIAQAAFDGPWIFNRYKPAGLPDAQSKESDDLHDISLHRMIRDATQADAAKREQAREILAKESDFRRRFESNDEDDVPSKREVDDYFDLVRSAERPEVERADIILCTCINAASGKFHDVEKSHCIVDEAGQCTEPETLVAINGTTKRIVLIGDHKQLRPVVQNNDVSEVLNISMFERLFENERSGLGLRAKQSGRAVMLTTQYRMHKNICAFPSLRFYENMLETAPEVERRHDPGQLYVWPECWRRLRMPLQHQQPKCFIHVEGEEKVTPVAEKGKGGDESKSNAKEVDMIVQVIRSMQKKKRLRQHSVRVITPYTAQRDAILRQLEAIKKLNCFKELKIGSVAETQGGEADFVILSTVRSMPKSRILSFPARSWLRENLGFVQDSNQINVAITRAKFGLIIIGNQHLLSVNAMWRELIRNYREQRCVLDCREAKEMFS